MPTSYSASTFANVKGNYVLQFDCPRFHVTTMDGAPYDILPHRIVRRVYWMDNESSFKRLWRKLTGKLVIQLPAPDKRFAVITIEDFERCFRAI